MSTNQRDQSYDLKNAIANNRFKGMWRMMHGFRLPFITANVSLAISALFKSATFLLLGYYIDNVVGKNELNYLLPLMAAAFVLIAILEGSFTYFSGRLAAYTAEGVVLRLRNYLYDHIQRLTFAFHARTMTGELIQRSTSDVDALRRFFAEQAIGVGRILLLFIVNFTALLILNVPLALISVIVVPFVFIASLFFFKRISKLYEEYQEQEAKLSAILQENLSGVRVVKAFARQDYEREKFEIENWEKFLRGRKFMLMHSYFWPITDILCGFQMLAGYLVGSLMAINGTITLGTYMAYAGLVVWLIWPIRNLGRLVVHTSTGMVSFERIMNVIREEREPLEKGDIQPSEDVHGEITFENVCFEYEDGETPVLENVSFHCKPGQAIALLGSTGSGKTSLVNLLPRFYEYNSGRIMLDKVELKRYSRKFLRSQIGIVEQEPFLFSRTIYENIAYGVGRDVDQEEIEDAAKAAAIHDVILTFPDGYNTLVGERGVTLSGGQKQRIAIARTLLRNPRILILDDSTSSVDTETEAQIRAALVHLMQGRTTFIIAHRIQSVMDADWILVLDKGSIVQQGSHEELLTQEGIYRQIHDIQLRIETELEHEIDSVDTPISQALSPERVIQKVSK